MNHRQILWPSIIAAVISFTNGDALAQTAKDVIGTWTLVSITGDPFGPNPKGTLVFDEGGRFVQMIARSDIPRYASGKREQGTPDEYKASALGTNAFFGTYSITGTDLRRHIEAATYPNVAGTDQKLDRLTVTGDRLTWSNPSPMVATETVTLIWQRAK